MKSTQNVCFLLLTVLSFMFCSSLPLPSYAVSEKKTPQYKNKWALIVGVDSFQEAKINKDIKLDIAASDFKDVLIDKYNFKEESVLFIQNTEAARDAISASLGKGYLGGVCGKNDLALVFVSTLCFPANNGKVYLCPYDANFDNFFSSCISMDEFMRTLKESVKCKDIVVIIQAPFTGAPQLVSGCRAQFGEYNIKLDDSKLPENFVVVSSSQHNQPTWGTYFSDNLIKTLQACKADVDFGKIYKLAHDNTVTSTIKDCTGCKIQSPKLYGAGANNTQIKIGTKPALFGKASPKSDLVLKTDESIHILGRARELVNAGKPNRALKLIEDPKMYSNEKWAQDEHSLPMIDYFKGLVYEGLNNWSEAKRYFQAAVKKEPTNSIYHSELARAKTETKEVAVSSWSRSYQLDNESLDAILGLADCQSNLVNQKKLISRLKGLAKIYPDNADLHDRLSLVYSRLGNKKMAIAHAKESVFLDDNSWTSLINLGSLLLSKGSYNEAQAAFKQALELNPDSSEGYFLLASALERTKDPAGAIRALKQFINLSRSADKRKPIAKKKIVELKKFLAKSQEN